MVDKAAATHGVRPAMSDPADYAGPVDSAPVIAPLFELVQKLEQHQLAISGSPHGPIAWAAIWTTPQAEATASGEARKLPVLFHMVDMSEEEVDVQEACDAGLVDREDLVDPISTFCCIHKHNACAKPANTDLPQHGSCSCLLCELFITVLLANSDSWSMQEHIVE